MSEIFLKIVNMSISSGWVVLAVLLLRVLLKKAPKGITALLWGIVAIRLVSPVCLRSAMSLIPSGQTVSPEIMSMDVPSVNTGVSFVNAVVNSTIRGTYSQVSDPGTNSLQVWIPILAGIWLAGIVILLGYTTVSYLRLRRKISTAVLLCDNIFQSEAVASPFVLGMIRPKIYLPFQISRQDTALVIAHERAHICRRDYIWKPLGFLLLSVYWFHPLMWLAYVLFCRDIELACDEKVIKALNGEERADYSQALLACSINRSMIAACPLAFSEVDVKERVEGVMKYKKPTFWVITAAVVVLCIMAVCLLTNPKYSDINDLDSQLKAFLDRQVAQHHGLESTEENFVAISYDLMKVDEAGSETTIYAWILDQIYSCENEILKEESGAYTPTVITVRKHGNSYELAEYWEPRAGDYYPGDIKDKFPIYLWRRAMDEQRAIDVQRAECRRKAEKYFKLTETSAEGILKKLEPYHTEYMGDAPKVATVAGKLPYPKGYRYSSIELQSEKEPYELIIYLDRKKTQGEKTEGEKSFEQCAAIAFKLIDNMEVISFRDANTKKVIASFSLQI